MDRVANHRTAKVTDVDEDKRIMSAVARLVTSLVDGTGTTTNVVSLR